MDLEARNALPEPSADAIADLEAVLKVRLPQEYLDLLGRMNGAYIQGNIFDIPGGNNAGVSQFIPFDRVLYEKALMEQTGPTKFVPIAHASGGNYVCMSMKASEFGSVYFSITKSRVTRLLPRSRRTFLNSWTCCDHSQWAT